MAWKALFNLSSIFLIFLTIPPPTTLSPSLSASVALVLSHPKAFALALPWTCSLYIFTWLIPSLHASLYSDLTFYMKPIWTILFKTETCSLIDHSNFLYLALLVLLLYYLPLSKVLHNLSVFYIYCLLSMPLTGQGLI